MSQYDGISCSVRWCDRPAKARGLCKSHHGRLMHGLPLDLPWGTRFGGQGDGRPRTDPLARILARLDADLPDRQPDECWEWPGIRTPQGYGQITVGVTPKGGGRRRYVHRVVAGEPEGEVVMHTCDNPPCCNPAHLRVGSQADNMRDMATKGRATSNQFKATA